MRPAIAYIHLDHLRYNYQVLASQADGAYMIAVVKADAYGHGLRWVAPVLWQEGCRYFAVTDAEEGMRLRDILTPQRSANILLLSGIFDEEDARYCVDAQLIPALTHEQQIAWLKAHHFAGGIWIKVNTGMHRLDADSPEKLLQCCDEASIQVIGIMSHLACADTPDHPLNVHQHDHFFTMYQRLLPTAQASLLNSAGLISPTGKHYDYVRTGIALYGSEPVVQKKLGLKPVMQLTGKVIQIHTLNPGDAISYGATFVAERPMQLAIVTLGYADGLPRALSNCGHAYCKGHYYPMVGRVCMDYCQLDCTNTPLAVGDCVEFWGGHLLADDIAMKLDTISYTLFTGVGERVHRQVVVSTQ